MLIDMQLWQLRRKVHASWLIALASAGIVVGAALVPIIGWALFANGVWLLVAAMMLGIAFWRQALYLLPLVVAGGMLLGLWRGSLLASEVAVYQNVYDHSATVVGKVSDDPEKDAKNGTVLRLVDVQIDGHRVNGKIWITTRSASDVKRGDIVTAKGKIGEGFGSFAATIFESKIVAVVRPQPGDIAGRVRDWFADKVRLGISEPQASLGVGYLLGQKSTLPDELNTALVATGLTHAVVASGYNLTRLVRLARRLFVRISKYLAAASAGVMIVSFIAVTGASPSMTRAGLVSVLSLLAWYYGRSFHPLVLLPFVAAITILIDPTYAWGDLGWQLSFAAFAGVMILAPLLQRYFFDDERPGIIRQILGETFSAHVLTLPILVLAFGQFSNVAIITNMLVLPLIPLAMLLTFVAGIGTIIAPSAAALVGLPAQWLLSYMTVIINYFAELSWAQMTVTIQPWMAMLAYIGIVLLCLYLWRVTNLNLRETNVVE